MKKLILNTTLAVVIACFFACSNNRQSEQSTNPGTTATAEEHNDAKFSSESEKDAQFVVDAANLNLVEVSLSDLALSRSTHQEVKNLAKLVSDQHAKANTELTQLAQKKNITVPTTTDLKGGEYTSLDNKNGTDFDKAYYNKLVEIHKDAISKFEKAAQDSRDADIRNYAASQLTILRSQLDRAMDDQKVAENW